MPVKEPLLEVQDVSVVFRNKKQAFAAVSGLSFQLEQGEILGIVGESGSGKTMASLSIMGLLPEQGFVDCGSIRYRGRELIGLSDREMCKIRGKEISMIFQEPIMSLDQVFTVGSQLTEAILTHEKIGRAEAKRRSLAMLRMVGIPSPERVFASYPFELSGGMCQRVMIAIALGCHPNLLIADEPTTALDVTVQAQIMDLLKKMRDQFNIGIILITHDLDVVKDMADRIIVMYGGNMMEVASREQLFANPSHPYTRGLLRSIPRLDTGNERLFNIEGTVPDIRNMPRGCHFCTRCWHAEETCHEKHPQMIEVEPGHYVSCHRAEVVQKEVPIP